MATFPKTIEGLMLVFDIGSSSVGGVLFQKEKTGAPKIIFTVREPIVLKEEINIDQFLLLTIKSLEVVVNKVYLAGLGVPTDVFCVLASPWYVSQTRVISFAKNTPFIFTSALADNLIQKEISLFKEEHLAKYTHTEYAVRLIELKNIKVMLNGYETLNPLNQKGQELEMTVFISMSPENILGKIEAVLARYFQVKEIRFSSFMMTFFTVIRDLCAHKDNFLLVDIGGEVTDISMVKKNVLRELISFPSGHNTIVRGVSTALNYNLNEAKSFLALLKAGHADLSLAKRLEPVISKLKAEWLHQFQDSLAHLSNDISIPATIYIVVDKSFADFFCQTIKVEQFNQYTLTESKFEIIPLSAEMFQDRVLFEAGVIRDLFLIIDSIYINRFLTPLALPDIK